MTVQHSASPRTPGRFRVRTVLVPLVAAVVVAFFASHAEIAVVGRSWSACDIGINASANRFGLIFLHLPALWVVQSTLIAGAALSLRR